MSSQKDDNQQDNSVTAHSSSDSGVAASMDAALNKAADEDAKMREDSSQNFDESKNSADSSFDTNDSSFKPYESKNKVSDSDSVLKEATGEQNDSDSDTFSGLNGFKPIDKNKDEEYYEKLNNTNVDSILYGSSSSSASKSKNAQIPDTSQQDPLLNLPRLSTRIWCVVLAVMMLSIATFLWWVTVQTVLGQGYEEMVIAGFGVNGVPSALSIVLMPLRNSMGIMVLGAVITVCSLILAVMRKRWWLVGQCAAIILLSIIAEPLKKILPRPMLISIEYLASNSAPSGHALIIAASCALIVCCASRGFRAWSALASSALVFLVSCSLVAGHWHRPSDVIVSVLIVGAITLLVLAFTRKSGMDIPGSRRSSISVQIVGTSMITLGVMMCMYAAYLIWQILPGVDLFARWAVGVSYIATYWSIAGVSLFVYGVLMVMRQATAAPLSRIGLVGAPPMPPQAK